MTTKVIPPYETIYELIDNKSVKVGNRTYVIEVKDEIREGELHGLCQHSKQVIQISIDQSIESLKDTLLHEILHVVWYVQSIDFVLKTEQLEEFIVGTMASTLMQVFQDNEWLEEVLWFK